MTPRDQFQRNGYILSRQGPGDWMAALCSKFDAFTRPWDQWVFPHDNHL
ncbi:hypothetical protein ABVN18_15565 [Pseudomonas canadensis]